jgi:hypothetical protein
MIAGTVGNRRQAGTIENSEWRLGGNAFATTAIVQISDGIIC